MYALVQPAIHSSSRVHVPGVLHTCHYDSDVLYLISTRDTITLSHVMLINAYLGLILQDNNFRLFNIMDGDWGQLM